MGEINWKSKENKQLIEAFLALQNADEAARFLRDLLTEKEIKEFASRLEAASMLSRGVRYDIITGKTGLSSTTVARVAKWLNGPLGGYNLILNRMKNISTNFNINHYTNSSKPRRGLYFFAVPKLKA